MRNMNRLFSILLCFALVLCNIVPAFAQDDSDAILISNIEEFLTFAENCRLDSYSRGKVFRLTEDIDLTGVDFDGIPVFLGTFDGSHHTISGLKIQSAGSAKGLFRYIMSGATVKNLRVDGTIIPTGSRSQVGGIAGSNAGTIADCLFTGTVIAANHAGGIAGVNLAGGLITDCSVVGNVSANHFSGGITGSNYGAVRNCVNHADINTTAQQNDIDISDITLGNLINTESATATTDIGGIAGYSDGVILGSTNRGSVGYKHMGYNVGGIVGMQAGYVADCDNYGAVSGRKEVGGIAGQQEPEVIIHYSTDTLQILEAQLAVLSDLIDKASANSNANASHIRNLIYKIETYIANAEAALDYLKSGLEDPKWEDLQSYSDALKTIRSCLEGIDATLRDLWDAMDNTISDLDQDMKAISDQMAVIENTLNNAEDHLGGKVFDSSDEDSPEDLTSKIENCRNFATILGDLNAGGIVGAIVFENDLDPEEDISVIGDTTLNAIGSLRSVVLSCTNTGTVSAKNQRIGGIVGWMSMGLVKECINTGSLENDSANYVGGIAGYASGYIRNCKVKSAIAGASYVGGIAGNGTIVTDCYAMVHLSGEECVGAIFGFADEAYSDVNTPIANNFYLHTGVDHGGIDGISFDGQAQALSQEVFFDIQKDCPIFSQVTIQFWVDGKIFETITLPSGSALEGLPQVPAKEGFVGQWSGFEDTDLQHILFDISIYATYNAYSVTVESDLTKDNGKPILLLQGDFNGALDVTLKHLKNFAALKADQKLIEGWTFSAEHCVNLHAGRLLMPEDLNLENIVLMVRDANGNWNERVYTVSGSYLVFSLGKGDDALALVEVPAKHILTAEILVSAGVGAVMALIVVISVLIVVKAKQKKIVTSEESVA